METDLVMPHSSSKSSKMKFKTLEPLKKFTSENNYGWRFGTTECVSCNFSWALQKPLNPRMPAFLATAKQRDYQGQFQLSQHCESPPCSQESELHSVSKFVSQPLLVHEAVPMFPSLEEESSEPLAPGVLFLFQDDRLLFLLYSFSLNESSMTPDLYKTFRNRCLKKI